MYLCAMKLLKVLLYIVLGVGGLVAVMGLFARKKYYIERSITIKAPREVVLEQLRFFKNFEKWSPWHNLDPHMATTMEGTDGEPGAVYRWEGKGNVGKGWQQLQSASSDSVVMIVHLLDPWESTSHSKFAVEGHDSTTTVKWNFDMHIGFPWNGLAMFTDIQRGVGKDYERGLGNLKKRCEHIVNPTYNGFKVAESDAPDQYFVGLRDTLAFAQLGTFVGPNHAQLSKTLDSLQRKTIGPWSVLTWVWDEKAKQTDLAVAFPVEEDKKATPLSPYNWFNIPASKALTIDFYGPYDSIGNAHKAMDLYMIEKKWRLVPPSIESYITDPAQEPDTLKWLTKVIYRVVPAVDSI